MRRVQFWGLTVFTLFMGLSADKSYAQDSKPDKQEVIQQIVAARNFVFKVQTVQPTGPSPNRQITSEYDLKISPDSIISFLPYFGRAYTAPMDPTKGGIQFTSTKFDYKQEARKKGGWDITIKPQDTQDTRLMTLTVSDNGYASLQVISNNRQPISFTGYITQKKSKR
ncbi:DUF4251 domain-containing protein [Chitinophaga rhizophila]|uniref:DUF4251 domain-containing protein n=1 Tax=Chitinophaga rhizophila TaxID=2866212 RepID=A0ABS7GHP2_9BACT|nr:DUF4251 domain-containing protein [Chitinophaga rhizophila]MBW8686946.1 DUF4251 domain-containing protein [Chitinophaga rhizophila]